MELTEHIYLIRAPGAKPEWIAEVLDRLVWITSDNGAEICKTLRKWLLCEDKEKVEIALVFSEVSLWNSASEMNDLLSEISTRFPSLMAQCEASRSAWSDKLLFKTK